MVVAFPELKSATGHWNTALNNGSILALYDNIGEYGWILISAGNYSTDEVHGISRSCNYPKTGLSYGIPIKLVSSFTSGFVNSYACNSVAEQNCLAVPPTCSNMVIIDSLLDFPIVTFDPTKPDKASGYVISGNGSLTLVWLPVTNVNIFAYFLRLKDNSGIVIEEGFLPASATLLYTFKNLTNGAQYTIGITAISHSQINGDTRLLTGVPGVCYIPVCNFIVTQ